MDTALDSSNPSRPESPAAASKGMVATNGPTALVEKEHPLVSYVTVWHRSGCAAAARLGIPAEAIPGRPADVTDDRSVKEYFDAWTGLLARYVGGSDYDGKTALLRSLAPILNAAAWPTLASRHLTPVGVEYENLTVPLNAEFASHTPAAAGFARCGTGGKSSLTQSFPLDVIPTPQLLANGWFTRTASSERGEVFAAFRSGSMVHHGEKDAVLRKGAADMAAYEILSAAAAQQLARLAPERVQAVLDGRECLKISIVTLDLQSTAIDPRYGLSLENWSVPEHRAAMSRLEAVKRVALELPMSSAKLPIEVGVDVTVMPFNFPVHILNYASGRGWSDETRALNEASFARLLAAEHGDFTPASVGSEAKRAVVERALRQHFDEYNPGEPLFDPYRYSSLIANYAYLAGHVPHFNCRSGKDRTGMLDAEAKLHAIALDRGHVLDPSKPLSEEDSMLLADLAIRGGSAEIQRLNTGVAGSKIRALTQVLETDPIATRIGLARWNEFRGYARLAEM